MSIAEILKNCPKGMKLYSPIYGEMKFIQIMASTGNIHCRTSKDEPHYFYPDGKYESEGECVLFPSKEQRDWSKFQIPFKFGDIVATYNKQYQHTHIAIFDKYIGDKFVKVICTNLADSNEIKIFGEGEHWHITGVRYATDKEKEFFFNFLKEQNYVWTGKEVIEKKFDIRSLKPYDKVLVRSDGGAWYPSIVSYVSVGQVYLIDSESSVDYVIPFESNEHLVGRWDDPVPYYITWK